ncbi:peptidylprolyl isomerase [Neptuniibacter pectenicola]|jgi:FKBP-type peptidyl-prolyl cis-trans isomerase SlpA|uniref:Peptidyl-prolyl cis-trans isomerase n=1 Tax=Neptuniibacter pectenicola TaxID=1806669 RepID=A0ABU9TSN7_9GAMM|nr:MAG: peptidylprolyl isomerase [Neptuniibacter sp. Phe_28]
MSKLIGPGKTVTLHFAIKLADGQVVDSTFDKEPATFTVGDGNLLEGFEKSLFGLEEGAKQTLKILPENGFGMPNPSNIHNVPRSQFEGVELELGLVISFSDAGKGELPGVVSEFDDKMVAVDFNHPLAGKQLDFEVEILQVS